MLLQLRELHPSFQSLPEEIALARIESIRTARAEIVFKKKGTKKKDATISADALKAAKPKGTRKRTTKKSTKAEFDLTAFLNKLTPEELAKFMKSVPQGGER